MHNRLDDASEYSRHFPPQNAETDIALGEASWYDDARQSRLPPAPKGKASNSQYDVLEQCREVRDDEVPESPVVRYRPGIDTFIADFFALTVPIAFLIFVIILVSKSGQRTDVASIQQWKDAAYVVSTNLQRHHIDGLIDWGFASYRHYFHSCLPPSSVA
jgi:hypothetical protein